MADLQTKPPLETPELQMQLWEKFAAAGLKLSAEKDDLVDVSIVGAVISNDGKLFHDDAARIAQAVGALSKSGIKLGFFSRYYFYSLLPPVGSDFLKANHTPLKGLNPNIVRSDLLITLGVNGSLPNTHNIYDNQPAYRHRGLDDFYDIYGDRERFRDNYMSRLGAISAWQDPAQWEECARNIGAKVIITSGGKGEINTGTFESETFRVLIGQQENYLNDVTGPIGGSLGVVMRNDYAQGLKGKFNLKSPPRALIYNAVQRLPAAQCATRPGRHVSHTA